ncbi:hypothetical protein Pla108_03910 [Botrimarina colliarenosi]|uniref:Uncharacterized protein n=1 Tax=Botrimarina colliarenosi TaxID=2528001 RepID=A0A5C6AHD8_9BACT|nr:transmembrane prediction [Botrimarina colliarenosi]TWT99452.1 hypothetical protein Pla108_03910 [Botrimarina colliarenosi]
MDATPPNAVPNAKESDESLLAIFVSPAVWAAHFMACYITAAVWCEKFSGDSLSLAPVRVAFGVYTLLAVALIGVNGWFGYRRIRRTPGDHAYGADRAEDRHRFLGYVTTLLAGLSLVATLFVAAVALFVETCH